MPRSPTLKTHFCDLCQWSRWEIDPKAPLTEYGRHTHICDKGHKPRWKEPTSPVDQDWGFKRRDCEDYKEIVF